MGQGTFNLTNLLYPQDDGAGEMVGGARVLYRAGISSVLQLNFNFFSENRECPSTPSVLSPSAETNAS